MSPTTSPCQWMRSMPVSVTSPMTVASRPQRVQTSCTSSSRAGSTMLSMRSWLSETMISQGSMSASRSGTRSTWMSRPTRPLLAISEDELVSPAAPRSCMLTTQLAAQQLEAGLDELLLGERVADLDAGPLFFQRLVELLAGQHAGAADAVAPRLGADEQHEVAHAGRLGAHDLVGAQQAGAHGVDQAVAGVAVFEVDLAADGGDADAVAVEADAADHVLEQVALARLVELAEAQRVEAGDGPRAHGEDVADDAADAGGGALEGLDGRRVVVALDLHGHGPAVAHVDDAGVLAGALQHARAGRGEAAQEGRECL